MLYFRYLFVVGDNMVDLEKIFVILKEQYKDSRCALNFENEFQLLIASRLSAQCKDSMVNKVIPALFNKFPDVHSLSIANVEEIEKLIKPCGLFKIKAKNLKDMCTMIENKFESKIPFGLDNLQKLPGIGRKTANLIMSEIFGVPSVVVDTHVIRITRRLGIHNHSNALKIEMILRKNLNQSNWSKFCHCLVSHGREVCNAKSPKCSVCCLKNYCKFYQERNCVKN